jgi:hypothetical protein
VKYRLLSKEQFEALNKEFATFLATQEITKQDWELIKQNESDKVQRQLENFSDLVWEEVLGKTKYLEHYSADSINLFYCQPEQMERIVVRVEKKGVNLLDKEDFNWFIDNSNDKSIQYFKGTKPYTAPRNEEIFKLIEQGAVLADGKLFKAIHQILNSKK